MSETLLLTQVSFDELLQKVREAVREELENLPASPNVSQLITEKELCQHLGISLPTAHRYRKRGDIPFIEIGNSIRYDLQSVIEKLKARGR